MHFSFRSGTLLSLVSIVASARGAEPVVLREAFAPGYQYHVSCRVELSGALTLPAEAGQPAKSLPVSGDSAIEYDERVLSLAGGGAVEKTARIYRRADFHRKVGDKPQESTIRAGVRRLILMRVGQVEVPFSPDGPLLWSELDLVRTDVFTPALLGMLPEQPVRPGERWTARDSAVQELTDLEKIDDGKLECRLDQVTLLGQHHLARVAFSGTVRGINEDGPNRQKLDGFFFFDLTSRHLSYLSLKGVNFMLDKDGKEQGRVEGQFVLTRQANTSSRDLSDEVLRNVNMVPNEDNTQLLYDSEALGLQFLYPRRWRVAGMRGQQLGIDERRGSGLLLTVEPAGRVPSGAQYLAESLDWLKKEKARVLRSTGTQVLQPAPNAVEQFSIEMEMGGKRAVLDYYVIRQPHGGATLAARLLPEDLAQVRRDVERIARSIKMRPIKN